MTLLEIRRSKIIYAAPEQQKNNKLKLNTNIQNFCDYVSNSTHILLYLGILESMSQDLEKVEAL